MWGKFIAIFFVVMLLLCVPATFAEDPQTTPNPADFSPSQGGFMKNKDACIKDNNGVCLEVSAGYSTNAVMADLNCSLIGACSADPAQQGTSMEKSVLGFGMKTMAFMYEHPPTSTGEYLAYMGEKAGFVPKAYAQGITWARLQPIFPLWKLFRNIAFMILTIMMFAIGFMIMLRRKINPQTVAKIENTIPNLVVTMILVALSLPIAALVIDLMYVAIAVSITAIGSVISLSLPAEAMRTTEAVQDFTTGNMWVLLKWGVAFPTLNEGGALWDKVQNGNWSVASGAFSLFFYPFFITKKFMEVIFLSAVGAQARGSLFDFFSPLLVLVMAIVLIISFARLAFILISNYVQMLTAVIFGPIILAINAIPGQNTFDGWLRGLIGNASAFVITAVMLYIVYAISFLTAQANAATLWVAPMVGMGSGEVMSQSVVAIISLGVVNLIPQFIKTAKEKIKAKTYFNVGPNVITEPVGSAFGKAMGIVGGYSTLNMAGVIDPIAKIPGLTWLKPKQG